MNTVSFISETLKEKYHNESTEIRFLYITYLKLHVSSLHYLHFGILTTSLSLVMYASLLSVQTCNFILLNRHSLSVSPSLSTH